MFEHLFMVYISSNVAVLLVLHYVETKKVVIARHMKIIPVTVLVNLRSLLCVCLWRKIYKREVNIDRGEAHYVIFLPNNKLQSGFSFHAHHPYSRRGGMNTVT